ncbi:MAG: FecR family protein, partial [Pirellulales bacterium]
MKPGDVQPVIDKYLEDRGGLTEEEMGALINALQVDRKLAVLVKEQMLLDEMLRQKLAADGRHFSAQVGQRIRDHQSGELEFEHKTVELHGQIERALVGDIHGLSSGPGQAGKRIRRRKSPRPWLVAVLLLVGASASIALVGWNSQQNRAVIAQAEGEVLLVRQGRPRPLAAMAEVRDGDRFETSANGKLVLRYHDGTTVKMNGKTKATFRTGWSKEIAISEGNILADVIPQQFAATMKFRTPAADALVVGTKLRITAREGGTRLDVMDGAVNLTRT